MDANGHSSSHADIPVAARGDIVVGIDESAASAAALRWAVGHGIATGLPLRLVRTWQVTAAAAAAISAGAFDYPEAAAADARARATRWVLDTLGGEAVLVPWTLEVHEGAAGPVLVAISACSGLLVVGTHEHTGLRRAVPGSVSHYVLSHTRVPVVAVPAAAPTSPRVEDRARDAMTMGPLY